MSAAAVYIYNRIRHTGELFGGFERNSVLLSAIWIIFVIEMVLRFFPSSIESMGCQKQFSKNYKPTGREEVRLQSWKRTAVVLASWVALNAVFGALYLTGVFDSGMMLLIALAYSVCDMICILFFCPFQTWMMKNRCCVTCRIYNWDFAMMFTPLIFVRNLYAQTLVLISLVLLLTGKCCCVCIPSAFLKTPMPACPAPSARKNSAITKSSCSGSSSGTLQNCRPRETLCSKESTRLPDFV